MSAEATRARTLAAEQLAVELLRRWVHVQAVATKSERVASIVPDPDRPVMIAAAWLHDVGYSNDVASTGFHPLDGARWLRARPPLVAEETAPPQRRRNRAAGQGPTAQVQPRSALILVPIWS